MKRKDNCSQSSLQITHYIPYIKYRDVIENIYEKFQKGLEWGELMNISRESKIPYQTLNRWYSIFKEKPEWRPWNTKRNKSRRIFNSDEEDIIVDFIKKNYLDQNKLFTNRDFKKIALQFHLDFHGFSPPSKFNCSDGFISDFKKRHGFSSRKSHFKRRPSIVQEQINIWKNNLQKLLSEVSHDFILNVDETNWMVYPNDLRTWAPIGQDNVQLSINSNEKEDFTCLATISASGKKFPLQIIAKGKTERCEQGQILQNLEENQNV